MRLRYVIVFSMILSLAIALNACSGRGNPTTPAPPANQATESPNVGNTHIWGYWMVYGDAATGKFEIMPVRDASMHLNVIQYLEVNPCTNCFKILSMNPGPGGTYNIGISFRHPYTNLDYTGFDVRGIAIFNGSHQFPASGLNMSNRNMGDGEVVNADGYTSLYNPFTGGHDYEGYIKGKLANTGLNAKLNAFKRFVSNKAGNTRNAFWAGDTVNITYQIKLPNPLVFGYAIDASWTPPKTSPVKNPITDFGTEANCPEAWQITVSNQAIGDGLTSSGGSEKLIINAYDWQGADNTHPVLVECPELFNGQVTASWTLDAATYSQYEAVVQNSELAPVGNYRCLISKEAKENSATKPWLDLKAYQVYTVTVIPPVPPPPPTTHGWARTWGGASDDVGQGAAVDSSGNVYAAGYFYGSLDFDPGSGVDVHTSIGGRDIFLSKFDKDGNFIWARTWGGSADDTGNGVTVDPSGNAFVSGRFQATVDFDPGPGVDNHTSNAGAANNIYLSKFDSSGNFKWARTWGGTVGCEGYGCAADGSGNVYEVGDFQGTADFDPGPGTDTKVCNGFFDAWLVKYDTNGNYIWGRSWGKDGYDDGPSVAVDASGFVYDGGMFQSTMVDFDPGPGTDFHSSNGYIDAFLSKFDSNGNFIWAKTWGGADLDVGESTATDGSGNAYVAGYYSFTVNFDPGGGTDNHTSNGGYDAFLTRLDTNGNFVWAKTWGGTGDDTGNCVAIYGPGNLYVSGRYHDTVDFDPGAGVDSHISNGGYDAFFSKFDNNGAFIWTRTWGGASGDDGGFHTAMDSSGNAYIAGTFAGTADFDPGSGVENHTTNGGTDAFLIKFLPGGTW